MSDQYVEGVKEEDNPREVDNRHQGQTHPCVHKEKLCQHPFGEDDNHSLLL
jgi:hypothetical protein